MILDLFGRAYQCIFEQLQGGNVLKLAEHSFRARFRWCNSARAQGFQKTNMPSIEIIIIFIILFYYYIIIFIYSTTALAVLFFSIIERSVLIALVFYYKYMLEKVTMQRTQQFSAFVCYRKSPIKCNACADARKIETDYFSRNVPISDDPVVRILRNLPKNRLESKWLIYQEKFEFWHREFFIIQKTINGELKKLPMSKFN